MKTNSMTMLAVAMAISANADITSVSGVYPHLAMLNDEGECGTGAVVPWAGDLWKNGTASAAYWLWRRCSMEENGFIARRHFSQFRAGF